MNLTFKYRLRLRQSQYTELDAICESQRQLYNAAIEERIDHWRKLGATRRYKDQCRALTECRRELPEMAAIPANLQRWTLKRVDDAYAGFFRRLNSRGRAGFPRFKSMSRWDSFGFNEFTGILFDGKRLRFKGVKGGMLVHLHRPIVGEIKSCVFRREGRCWWVSFQVRLDQKQKHSIASSVGLDLGIKVFAYQSDGVIIPNPKFSRRSERKMRVRQRQLSRCQRGSKRRAKIKAQSARLHRKIANQRTTWLHQQSARIARSYDLIATEDLRVANMLKNPHLARSIADAGWSKFLAMVAYKAEKAGGHFVSVDPRNTSQKCSGCGELVPKSLAVRTHACPHCGLVIDRDWNAAKNILAAVVGRGEHNVAQWGERALGNVRLAQRPH